MGHQVRIRSTCISAALMLTAAAPRPALAASEQDQWTKPPTLEVPLPKRSLQAKGGRALLAAMTGYSLAARERVLIREILAGNVPAAMRTLVPIKLVVDDKNGARVNATAWVMPDYIAVGSEADYVHVPLSLPAARRLAAALGLTLPTVPIVDAIYEQADIRLTPQPLPPSKNMSTIGYVLQHEALLVQQFHKSMRMNNLKRPQLIAGHKKDVVLSKRLQHRRDRVAIFGWHRAVGRPIQPLSTVHGQYYVDYSHGIRFIAPEIRLDTPMPNLVASAATAAVAKDPAFVPNQFNVFKAKAEFRLAFAQETFRK